VTTPRYKQTNPASPATGLKQSRTLQWTSKYRSLDRKLAPTFGNRTQDLSQHFTPRTPLRALVVKFTFLSFHRMSRDSSVGIALGYGLDDRGSRVRLLAGLGIFLFTTASRTVLGSPSLLSNGIQRLFPWG
jgi:hypothetical protein